MGRSFRIRFGMVAFFMVRAATGARPATVQPSPAPAPSPSARPAAATSPSGVADSPKADSLGIPEGQAPPAANGLPPDVVQTIEGPTGSEAPVVRPALPERPIEEKFRLDAGGWLKHRLDYFPLETPAPAGRSDFVSRTDLLARARYARGRYLEVNVSGSLTHTVFHGLDGFRGAFDPELRETSVGLFTSGFDFRFGQQRLAWGVTDFLSPNDILNARDLRDPFVGEQELRFIPTPMIRADWYVGIVTFQAVFAPWFVADRFDVYGTNWSGIQPASPAGLPGAAIGTLSSYDRSLFDQAQRLYQQTRLPVADYTEPSAGAQFAINGDGFDLHFYYHYGFDGPYVRPDASGTGVSATYLRRHHAGLAMTTSIGPVVLRLEGAYQSQRAFFQTDLFSHKSPAAEAAGALEWQTGDPAKLALLELYYQRVIDKPEIHLLAWDQDSYGAALSFRWPIFGALRTDSRVLVSPKPVTVVAKLDLELNFDNWIIGAGWLAVGGDAPSFGSYYRKNSEAFWFVKWLY